MNDVTAIVKAFERPAFLQRLLEGLRRYYPDLPVLVVDDSQMPANFDVPGVKNYQMPYDSGLSAGRNFLLEKVETEYFLLLDDDFVFTDLTRIERLRELMERDTDIDIMGGAVWNNPTGFWNYEGGLDIGPHKHVIKPGRWNEERDGYVVCDIIPNFFLGRTERVKLVRWDARLKLSEHVDFFVRAREAGLVVGFCSEVRINHDRRKPPKGYSAKRGRSSQFFKVYQHKYKFSSKRKQPNRRVHAVRPIAGGRR